LKSNGNGCADFGGRHTLATRYRPDVDVDRTSARGEKPGRYDHANLRSAVVALLRANRGPEWENSCCCRTKVSANHGGNAIVSPERVASISHGTSRSSLYLPPPPLVCIEVLSKDETLTSLEDRVDDYMRWESGTLRVLDPEGRRARDAYTKGFFREPEDGTLRVPNSSVRIPLKDLFAGSRTDRALRTSRR